MLSFASSGKGLLLWLTGLLLRRPLLEQGPVTMAQQVLGVP